MPVERTDAARQRRAADTRRWRERLHRGAAVYPVEVDGQLFDLMERFGELKDSKTATGRLSRPLWARCCAARWRRCCGKKLLPAVLINAANGRMSPLGADRIHRDGGNDVNDPEQTSTHRGAKAQALVILTA